MPPDVSFPSYSSRSVLPRAAEPPRWAAWAGGALVVAATFITFLPVLRHDFVNWDDVANFVGNTYYRGLGWPNLRWMFTSTHVGHYTPVAWVTHALDYLLWGMNPWGYHLDNLLLHAANAGLFYLVARRLLAAGFAGAAAALPQQPAGAVLSVGAAFAGLVFAVHPLRVESVAWVTERQDVLCGLFYLLAGWAYLRGVDGHGTIQRRWWALSVGAFLLALLSKAAAMPLPVALLLLDIYPLRRVATVGWRRLLVEKTPYLVLAGLTAPVALIAQAHAKALIGYEQYGIGPRLAMTAYSFMFYPAKFLWSAHLSPFYEKPVRIDPLAPRFLLPMIGFLVVTAVLAALRRRWPAVLAAWVYSALLVLPIAGIVHVGVHLVADRYSYLSGLGFALLAGAALVNVLQARGTLRGSLVGACVLVAALVVVGLATGAWRQSKIWRDTETLWRYTLSVNPRNAHAHYQLGNWLFATGRPRESLTEYELAAALTDRAELRAVSLNAQAIIEAKRGELQSALGLFVGAVRAVPGYPDACRNLRQLATVIRVDPQELQGCPEIAAGEEHAPLARTANPSRER